MKLNFKISLLLIFLILFACSKNEKKINIYKEKSLDAQVVEVYNEAMKEFEKGDVIYAGRKFGEVELLYPQSIWAPRAILMSAYGFFTQGYYKDTINDLERFLIKYKNHSQTDYASDSEYKLDYIVEIIASKEMYLARYYVQREKWIPAINRFKKVVNEYDSTIYVEEALHRLVELHYKVGLISEAEKYAYLLGYNYQSSKWYEASYKILNKNYKKRKNLSKDNKDTILKKFKKLFK